MARSGWKTGMSLRSREREIASVLPSDGHNSTVGINLPQSLTFLPSDVLYLGELLLADSSKDIRRNFNIALAEEVRSQISHLVSKLEVKGITTEGYFDEKGRDRISKILTHFAELYLTERQTFLENNPNVAPVLQPLSHLPKDDLGFWHRVSHNGLALQGLSKQYSSF